MLSINIFKNLLIFKVNNFIIIIIVYSAMSNDAVGMAL